MHTESASLFAVGKADCPPPDILELHLERLRWMIQRYLRRFAHRLVGNIASYTEDGVGRSEVRWSLGLAEDTTGQIWLDELGIRRLPVIETHLSRLEGEIKAARRSGLTHHVDDVCVRFGLSNGERDLVLAAAAPRLSSEMSRLYAFAWADFTMKQPTVEFLAQLVSRDSEGFREALSLLLPGGQLRKSGVLELVASQRWHPRTPTVHAAVTVSERILEALQGFGMTTSRMMWGRYWGPGVTLEAVAMPDSSALQTLLSRARARVRMQGVRGVGRCTCVRAVAAEYGRGVLEVKPERASGGMLEVLKEALLEAQLLDAVLVWREDAWEQTPDAGEVEAARRLLEVYAGAVVVTVQPQRRSVLLDDTAGVLEVKPPGVEGQAVLWERALSPHLCEEKVRKLSGELARSFVLVPGEVQASVSQLVGRRERLCLESIRRCVQGRLSRSMSGLSTRDRAKIGLADVVLAAETREAIEEVLLDAKHRELVMKQWGFARTSPGGNGLSVMFSGPPGTGKTLVAGVLARALGRSLYRVDLSRVVDKYIGETEKNLGRVFDEASRAQAVLLFDEADSLFASRTEVRSSNDRYANLEVNYLLQRLEAYEGIAILTTNFSQNIDEAFMRRIRYSIAFPMPEAEERAELWRRLLPERAPVSDDIDYHNLGERFELSGGHIRNAILRAAVRAAEQGSPIDEGLLGRAAVRECREMGVLVHDHFYGEA